MDGARLRPPIVLRMKMILPKDGSLLGKAPAKEILGRPRARVLGKMHRVAQESATGGPNFSLL